jgi:hypothetical protein
MALQLTTDSPYNGEIQDAYHRIIEININYSTRSSHVAMACYINRQARLDGKQPIKTQSFDWSGDEFPFDTVVLSEDGINAVSVAYEKIKVSKLDEEGNETNVFVNATDC